MAMRDTVNLALHLKKMAENQPDKPAVMYPEKKDKDGRTIYSRLTFSELDRDSDCIAHGLEKAGIKRGTRTIFMAKPDLDFFSISFALIKTGAVPVMVDPGMGIGRMLDCLKEGLPEAFIGIPKAHVLRSLCPGYFKTVKTWITLGKRWFWGGLSLTDIRIKPWKPYAVPDTRENETAAIMFTTGSTGPAKGVVYTHGTFDAQVRHIQSHFNIEPDEIDLPTFPLFAIFDPALGMTAVIPEMDPTKPAHVNPDNIINAIKENNITNMFGSPALLNRVGRYGKQKNIKLPSLRRVVSAGAPVLPAVIKQFASMLNPTTEIHTPYGATEAFPILSISSSEILSETAELSDSGHGTCVGRPIEPVAIKIIRISDDPIPEWSDDLLSPQGDIGEITVKGDLVTRQYFMKPDADALAKIYEGDHIWHRMGDLGRMDEKGRIWFCGRKSHRVITETGTLFTIPCEALFNRHPDVFRSALVGVGHPGKQTAVICIEVDKKCSRNKQAIKKELFELAASHDLTKDIKTVLFHKSFPVDIRHNSKIFREKLSVWAAKKISA